MYYQKETCDIQVIKIFIILKCLWSAPSLFLNVFVSFVFK